MFIAIMDRPTDPELGRETRSCTARANPEGRGVATDPELRERNAIMDRLTDPELQKKQDGPPD
jgi:hypothetical protein